MRPESEIVFEQQAEGLIQEIYRQYGYDFRGYARASLYRRIRRFLSHHNLASVGQLAGYIIESSLHFEEFVQEITVNVTEMFRDPGFFLALRQQVLPILSTYPHIKIWDAGCSTGEELFSLAILLSEEGLLSRTKIYATDINQKVLRAAKEGIFSAANLDSYQAGYEAAGGKTTFGTYYVSNYGSLKFNSSLIANVVFYPHNLATDTSFNEFHLILCRNVLIYFSRELQQRVYSLFNESLVSLGYLCFGKKESLVLPAGDKSYQLIDKDNRIYRKTT